MVSRIWKRDGVHEVRGRTVVPGEHVAPRAPKSGGGGGRSMRLAIAFPYRPGGHFSLEINRQDIGPRRLVRWHDLAAEKVVP